MSSVIHTRGPATGSPGLASWARLALAAVLSVLVVGALALPAQAAATAAAGVGWVRAAHLVPGFGAARLDLVPATGGATQSVIMSPSARYGDVTGYQKVKPGTYTVTVTPTDGSSGTAKLSRRFTVAGGTAMTLAVVGTDKAPRLAALNDDLTPPKAGDVNVRVLPAASGTDALSVSAVGGPTIVQGAVLGQASSYASVPAGSWKLKVSADAMAATDASVTLRAGGVYTVIVLQGASGGLRTKVVTDAAGMPTAAMPTGGAQTGAGAMAADVSGAAAGGSAAWLFAALGALGLAASFGRTRRTASSGAQSRG